MGAQQSGRGITAVVFDVNGVLEDSVYSAIAEAATATGTDPTGLLEVFGGTHGADGNHPWHRAERGEIGLIRCVIGLAREARKYEFNVPVTALVHAITNLGVHQRSLDLVDELRSDGIAVGVITNGVKNFSKRWRHKTGAEERFDVILESWREGIRKPNPEIFHRLLQQLDRDPSEVLFVDDLEANVKAAEALGMHGLVFGRPSESCPEIRQRIANSRTINIGATI
jgi:epoxide hydrolase-like predicted phosphatase